MFVKKKDLIQVIREAFTDREVQQILSKQRQSAGTLSPQASKYIQSLETALQQAGSTSQMSARELAGAFGQGEPEGQAAPPPSGKEKVSSTPGAQPSSGDSPTKTQQPDYHKVFSQDTDPEKSFADVSGLYPEVPEVPEEPPAPASDPLDPKAQHALTKASSEFAPTLEPGAPPPEMGFDVPSQPAAKKKRLSPKAKRQAAAQSYLDRIAKGEPSPYELPKEPGIMQRAASGLQKAGTSLADYYSQMMPAPQVPPLQPPQQPAQPQPPVYSGPPMPAMPQTQQAVQQALAAQDPSLGSTMQSLAYPPNPEDLNIPYRQESLRKESKKNVRLPSLKEVFIGKR